MKEQNDLLVAVLLVLRDQLQKLSTYNGRGDVLLEKHKLREHVLGIVLSIQIVSIHWVKTQGPNIY